MNINQETLACCAILAVHIAALAYSYAHGWKSSAPLWVMRADLLAACLYALSRVHTLLGLGHTLTDIDMLYFALAEAVLLALSFLPLAGWMVWTAYAITVLLLAAITCFALTFKMRMF